MSTPLLVTKTRVPPGGRSMLERERLLDRLDGGLCCALTLVSAPAGYGKTTLLASWARRTSHPVAWFALDSDDNDPRRFQDYLVAALSAVLPDAGCGDAIDRDVPPQDSAGPGSRTEAVLTRLLNDVAQTSGKVVLIIDDYHIVGEESVHDIVAYLLDHSPAQLHIVIATRSDPPLPIARLRGGGRLNELRQTDLRFSEDEADELLRSLMGLELTRSQIEALSARTEGWVAGLQLAALSIRGHDDAARFVREFSGSNRYVLDYLIEEVLGRQSPQLQSFLISTSILRHLCGPLCDAVTETTDGQSRLESLERDNLFVVALDEERRWYRYHRLFADLLARRLAAESPDEIPTLHRRAAEWCEAYGEIEEAIEHRISAGDFEIAAQHIESRAEATLMRSELIVFNSWLDRLPTELVQNRPELCAMHAWSLLLAGRPLCDVEASIGVAASDSRNQPQLTVALRALLAIYQGRLDTAQQLSRAAQERLPEGSSLAGTTVDLVRHMTETVTGDASAAIDALERLALTAQEQGNALIGVIARCHTARARAYQGELHEAHEAYRKALAFATTSRGRLPIASEPLVGLADVERCWNDLDAAERHLRESLDLYEGFGVAASIDGYVGLARVLRARGDVEGAHTCLQEAERIAAEFDATDLDDRGVRMEIARLAVDRGDQAAIRKWADELGLHGSPEDVEPAAGRDLGDYHLRKYELLVFARYLLLLDRPSDALSFLEPLRNMMLERHRVDLALEILTLEAAAQEAIGEHESAITAIRQAIALGEPGRQVRPFLDGGPVVAGLLYEAADRGMARDYVGELLAQYPSRRDATADAPAAEPDPSAPPPRLVEPLSARELEILNLIADGLTNQEIANRLAIALATVKWHTGQIYGKLGVHSRTQAVGKAQSLGILEVG